MDLRALVNTIKDKYVLVLEDGEIRKVETKYLVYDFGLRTVKGIRSGFDKLGTKIIIVEI